MLSEELSEVTEVLREGGKVQFHPGAKVTFKQFVKLFDPVFHKVLQEAPERAKAEWKAASSKKRAALKKRYMEARYVAFGLSDAD